MDECSHSIILKAESIARYSHGNCLLTADSSIRDVLSYMEHENHRYIWAQQFHRAKLCSTNTASISSAFSPDTKFYCVEEAERFVRSVLTAETGCNLVHVTAVTSDENDIVVSYTSPKFTLHDVITYSPSVFDKSFTQKLFIIYQLLMSQNYLHSRGALLGLVTLKDMYLQDNMWLVLCPCFSLHYVPEECKTLGLYQDQSVQSKVKLTADQSNKNVAEHNISEAMKLWVERKLSNFDYLMIINRLAGRELGNPSHHPVLPWIMDFTKPLGGWRDLTKSKFRLNKGDDQLDQTYEVAQEVLRETDAADSTGANHLSTTPHHISDVLSEITYYTYKARRTDKAILCQHVRQKWVPHEYPSSIKRMQEWTPDECIPEFFMDAEIFESLHEDLADLEIPDWAESAEDFISQHRLALESDYVSNNLHHWIDLTFGYKLTGKAAIEAKNVCLELVDGHTDFTNHGVVQLFTKPHPQKRCKPTKYLSATAPEIYFKYSQSDPNLSSANTTKDNGDMLEESPLADQPIILPPDFDPLELLDRCDMVDTNTRAGDVETSAHESQLHEDTLYLGCLIAQIVLPVQTRCLPHPHALPLPEYIKLVRDLVMKHRHHTPRVFYNILERALEMKCKPSDPADALDLYPGEFGSYLPPVTPGLLLAPALLQFPVYFNGLHQVIFAHKLIEFHIRNSHEEGALCNSTVSKEHLNLLTKNRLNFHINFIDQVAFCSDSDWLELYLPYLRQVFCDLDSEHAVNAAWHLFSPLSHIIGMSASREHLSPLVIHLLVSPEISEICRVKLYHRQFTHQLLAQLGLDHFLSHCIPPLISALCQSQSGRGSTGSQSLSTPANNSEAGSANLSDSGVQPSAVLLDTFLWLTGKLGPLLTAKYLTSRILQSLQLCYTGSDAYIPSAEALDDELVSNTLCGDTLILTPIKCLQEIALLYGEQFILLQYIPYISHMVISSNGASLSAHSGDNLLASVTSLIYMIPCLSDSTLLDIIEEKLIADITLSLISIVSCPLYTFPPTETPLSKTYPSDACSSATAGKSVDTQPLTAGAVVRKALAFRLLDLIVLIGQRIGFEQTRRQMKKVFQAFFSSFDVVHLSDGVWRRYDGEDAVEAASDSSEFLDIKQSALDVNDFYVGTPVKLGLSPNKSNSGELDRSMIEPTCLDQLTLVFTAELAHNAYIQCCKLAGGLFIAQVVNDDLIQELYSQHEAKLLEEKRLSRCSSQSDGENSLDPEASELGFLNKNTNWFVPVPASATEETAVAGSPFSQGGNRLAYIPPPSKDSPSSSLADNNIMSLLADMDTPLHTTPTRDKILRSDLDANTERHLKGDWTTYWEHELGQRDTNRKFLVNQINLLSFIGHSGAIKSIYSMDGENSFISSSKDKTVKLWSLRNTGAGNSRCLAQYTYTAHKKSVYYCSYLQSVNKVVSCDGSIHVWDPSNGSLVSQYDPSRNSSTVSAVLSLDNHSLNRYLLAANSDSTIRFIDLRSDRLAHEFRTVTYPQTQLGFIRGMAAASNWLTIAHSAGVISSLDIRSGFHLASWAWKGMDWEIVQMKAYSNSNILLSSSDGQFGMWRYDSSSPSCMVKLVGGENYIHSIELYSDSIVTASNANKVSIHKPDPGSGKFITEPADRLRADMFKGNLTSMSLLPMNRQLLLGSDNGTIQLIS